MQSNIKKLEVGMTVKVGAPSNVSIGVIRKIWVCKNDKNEPDTYEVTYWSNGQRHQDCLYADEIEIELLG